MRGDDRRVDALIVGGGPAGLSAAIVLARVGVRTLLCEKEAFPVDKACGEGIMPTGVAHLAQLGASQHLAREDVYPFAFRAARPFLVRFCNLFPGCRPGSKALNRLTSHERLGRCTGPHDRR